MKKYFIRLILLAFFLGQTLSCGRKDSTFNNATSSYIEDLRKMLSVMKVPSGTQRLPPLIRQPRQIKVLADSKNFVAVDDANKSIVLFNEQGKILSKLGGEGRGPGKFQNIVQLHVGCDGHIYLLDMLLFRITVYKVINHKLIYIKTFHYKNPPTLSLQSIYVTKFGNYGVYNQTKGFQSPNNNFLLYRLNESFGPVEQLLRMPGNKRQKVNYPNFTLYLPSKLLSNTLWDVDGKNFYFITSYQYSIHSYNFKTGESKVLHYSQFPERLNNRNYKIFMKKRYDFMKDKRQLTLLEENKKIPLFSGFWVQNKKFILRIFHPMGENGVMVYIDQASEKTKYFKTPYEYDQVTLFGKRIYGINFTDGGYQLIFFDLYKATR